MLATLIDKVNTGSTGKTLLNLIQGNFMFCRQFL